MTNICFHILGGEYSVINWIPTRLMHLVYFLHNCPNCTNYSSIWLSIKGGCVAYHSQVKCWGNMCRFKFCCIHSVAQKYKSCQEDLSHTIWMSNYQNDKVTNVVKILVEHAPRLRAYLKNWLSCLAQIQTIRVRYIAHQCQVQRFGLNGSFEILLCRVHYALHICQICCIYITLHMLRVMFGSIDHRLRNVRFILPNP